MGKREKVKLLGSFFKGLPRTSQRASASFFKPPRALEELNHLWKQGGNIGGFSNDGEPWRYGHEAQNGPGEQYVHPGGI